MNENLTGEYRIIKLYHPETEECQTLYFGTRKTFRETKLLDTYKRAGYHILGVLYVSKVICLKAKIEDAVTECDGVLADLRKCEEDYHNGKTTTRVFVRQAQCLYDVLDTNINNLRRWSNALNDLGHDMDNEKAIALMNFEL